MKVKKHAQTANGSQGLGGKEKWVPAQLLKCEIIKEGLDSSTNPSQEEDLRRKPVPEGTGGKGCGSYTPFHRTRQEPEK